MEFLQRRAGDEDHEGDVHDRGDEGEKRATAQPKRQSGEKQVDEQQHPA